MNRQYPTDGASSSADILHVLGDVAGVIDHRVPLAAAQRVQLSLAVPDQRFDMGTPSAAVLPRLK